MKAAVKLSGYTVDNFGDSQKAIFVKGIAQIAEVSEDAVKITSVESAVARRALLSTDFIVVKYSITVANSDVGDDVVDNLGDTKPVGTLVNLIAFFCYREACYETTCILRVRPTRRMRCYRSSIPSV